MKQHLVIPLLAVLLALVSCSTPTEQTKEITLDNIAEQLRSKCRRRHPSLPMDKRE